jgi:hypothetical protein
MPMYRLSIERTVRFQLDLEATSQMDALSKITATALVYDDRDLKETCVINVRELKEHVPDSSD